MDGAAAIAEGDVAEQAPQVNGDAPISNGAEAAVTAVKKSDHKHREHKKDRHRDKEREKSKDGKENKDKHKSSSSSEKHKSGDSSSKDKHNSSSSKHKDKHREKDRDSSKHRDSSSRHKSSSKDKHRDKDKRKSSDKPKTEVKAEATTPVKSEPGAVKSEPVDSDDDVPLTARMSSAKKGSSPVKAEKRKAEDSDDDVPLGDRTKKIKAEVKKEVKKEPKVPDAKKRKSSTKTPEPPAKKTKGGVKPTLVLSPVKKGGRAKKEEPKEDVWRWWEEKKRPEGVKWNTLEHTGPLLAPPYEPVPKNVKFYYDGKHMKLSEETEEVATFYAKMLEHDYTTKDIFNKNFFKDWRKVMTADEKEVITDLKKCNFREMNRFFTEQAEARKNRSKEEKKALKEQNAQLVEDYGYCIIDGHKQKIGNFRIEPPGLFRGRGEHPKMGMLKRRTMSEDVIINCSKGSKVPQPPAGHRWKEVRHDNTVTWLASWSENVQGNSKYVMLNAASRLKGEKDWQKYETARRLHKKVEKIREGYWQDMHSKEMRVRQRAVALYFIDKLALRAGNEKDDEQADTVGCCSLRVEHITLHAELDGKEFVVGFDFLGKDSIRYQNSVPVEKRVFKNLKLFMQNKNEGDDLFDRLDTSLLNKHLKDLMPGLTAKVFRTYNASRTLEDQLNLLTKSGESVNSQLLAFNRANRAVAILCNHQRAVPKTFAKSMENLQKKIDAKRQQVKEARRAAKDAKADFKNRKSEATKKMYEKKKAALRRQEEQLAKLEMSKMDKDEGKEIALGTSKLNYLDPRISVAWAKKNGIPVEKVYNKTQREKFQWAIDMAGPEFQFCGGEVSEAIEDGDDDDDEEEDDE